MSSFTIKLNSKLTLIAAIAAGAVTLQYDGYRVTHDWVKGAMLTLA